MDSNTERTLEIAYQTVCKFEQATYEKIYRDEYNQIVFQIDKSTYLDMEGLSENEIDEVLFSPRKYDSYEDLFNDRYRDIFRKNLFAIEPELLKNEIGEDLLLTIINTNTQIRSKIEDNLNIKELDLDNDGVSDRIDIDDFRNSVQTVADLSILNNHFFKESAKNKNNKELEL